MMLSGDETARRHCEESVCVASNAKRKPTRPRRHASQFREHPLQGPTRHAEHFCRKGAVVVADVEHVPDVPPLHLNEGRIAAMLGAEEK